MFRTFVVFTSFGLLEDAASDNYTVFHRTIGLKEQQAKGLRCSGILRSISYQRFRVAAGPVFEGYNGLLCDCSTAPRWKHEISQTKSLKLGKLFKPTVLVLSHLVIVL
jgi:hypothetical protein